MVGWQLTQTVCQSSITGEDKAFSLFAPTWPPLLSRATLTQPAQWHNISDSAAELSFNVTFS